MGLYSSDKEVDAVLRSAAKQGFTIDHGKTHIRITPPDKSKHQIGVTSSKLGSAKARSSFICRMRRAGWVEK